MLAPTSCYLLIAEFKGTLAATLGLVGLNTAAVKYVGTNTGKLQGGEKPGYSKEFALVLHQRANEQLRKAIIKKETETDKVGLMKFKDFPVTKTTFAVPAQLPNPGGGSKRKFTTAGSALGVAVTPAVREIDKQTASKMADQGRDPTYRLAGLGSYLASVVNQTGRGQCGFDVFTIVTYKKPTDSAFVKKGV